MNGVAVAGTQSIETLVNSVADPKHKQLCEKIIRGERIDAADAMVLFQEFPLGLTGALANFVREKLHGDRTYFNRNFHIEPTNVCVFSCKFCSYSRLYKNKEEGWELNIEQMMDIVKKYDGHPITEVHIVGGVHPKMDMYYFIDLIKQIKAHRPDLHVKGFTAVELEYMFRKAKVSVEEGMRQMHEAGLDSLPGGGAEIFAPEVRNQISADKVDGDGWLHIHKTAHLLGMHTNATMLYGHVENYGHRIDHMEQLRRLQDETKGFNTFIPLKFRNHDNEMSHVPETTLVEDMKLYAVARIYMDNFPHIKAYWPMLGRNNAQMSLSFGVNDIDGTIDDSTKIYSMAGSEEQTPTMSTEELVALIQQANRVAVERDTLYNEITVFEKKNNAVVDPTLN